MGSIVCAATVSVAVNAGVKLWLASLTMDDVIDVPVEYLPLSGWSAVAGVGDSLFSQA